MAISCSENMQIIFKKHRTEQAQCSKRQCSSASMTRNLTLSGPAKQMKALDELVFPETEGLAKEARGSEWTLLLSAHASGVVGIFYFDVMR